MKTVYRVLFYLLGLLLIAFGVAVSVNSNLGVSPVNSLPYAISIVLNVNMGLCVTLLYCFYVLVQVVLLRRQFKLKNLLQVVFATLFGYFVNFTRWLIGDFAIPTYAGQLAMMVMSILLIALGLVFYLTADIVPLPMEGMALAVSQKIPRLSFSNAKVMLDSASVLCAVAVSLIGTGQLQGVREGTIITALLAGKVMALFAKPLRPRLQAICFGPKPAPASE